MRGRRVRPDAEPGSDNAYSVNRATGPSSFLSSRLKTLIVFGIATSGAVLATALLAADMDYRVIVVKDCCADLDEGVHW